MYDDELWPDEAKEKEEGALITRHNYGSIILGLLDSVVSAPFLVVVAGLEHGKFEVEVGVEWEDDGEWRQDYVGDEGGHDCGEGLGQATDNLLVSHIIVPLSVILTTHR